MGAVPIVASVKLVSDWPSSAYAFCECHTGECNWVKVNSLLSEMERYLELDKNGDVEKRCLGFKVQPVTPPSVLKEKKMLHRMEMLCMQVQHDFTSNVERIEQGKIFGCGENFVE